MPKLRYLKELGVEIRCGVEVGKEVTLADLRADGYKAFYLAIGCQGGRKAGVPGEEAAEYPDRREPAAHRGRRREL